jgi:hypothetical protein
LRFFYTKKMKKSILFFIAFSTFCIAQNNTMYTDQINTLLNNWHKDAADANFKNYFNALTDDSIFIGTDATENWSKKQFQDFAKPFFDRGKAWNFTSLQRNIYFSNDSSMAWFDELLSTQMKICRGSGVLIKTENGWKIKHYVLSMTIPNDNTDAVVKIKAPIEDNILNTLKK